MEKTIETIQIEITQGPTLSWLEKRIISESNVVIAQQLHRRSFPIGTPAPENTPPLVIEVAEALAALDWPVTPGNPMP